MNKKKMMFFSLMAAAFLFLVGVPGNAAIPCCKNGQLSTCPDLPNGQQYDITPCSNLTPYQPGGSTIVPEFDREDWTFTTGDNCVKGRVQYRQNGSCGTSSRTCCSDGTWSAWDGRCSGSSNCTSSQCWDGSRCASKEAVSRKCSGNVANATGGTQTRTATCETGSGWSYSAWSGTCTCSTGYVWNSGTKTCTKLNNPIGGAGACKISSCPPGKHMVNAGTANCCCESNTCGQKISNNNYGPCFCVNRDPSTGGGFDLRL